MLLYTFIIVSMIVYEKAFRLRTIMKMMGLKMQFYWVVNYLFYYVQYWCMVGILWGFASTPAISMQTFVGHDQGIIFLFFFFWGHSLIAYSFLLTVFFNNTKTSTAVCLLQLVIIVECGRNMMQQLAFNPYTPEESYTFWMCIPPIPMIRGMYWLGLAGLTRTRIDFENWGEFADGVIPRCIVWMACEWFVCMVLQWYLEQVMVVGDGVRKHPLFCLKKRYWLEVLGKQVAPEKLAANDAEIERAWDVQQEHERLVAATEGKGKMPMIATVDMKKVYKAQGSAAPKFAVKGVSLGINESECLGLLGHNGAGKTTFINMLSGLFGPTSGKGYVCPYEGVKWDLEHDLAKVHQIMGVCPQHDVLWGALSGRRHIMFYGRLKGLTGSALEKATQAVLFAVNLGEANVAYRRAGRYSGGMKRRLSVACAIIGSPKIVYLDEPSTGLDPASKHQLWDVISKAKKDKSIILTTHSMEEADVLCDRLAIMSEGQVQCIGVSASLKQRFGVGYTLQITTSDRSAAAADKVKEYVTKTMKSARLLQVPLGGISQFEVMREDVVLSQTFTQLTEAKPLLGVTDWAITETTLEEVFLKLTEIEHMELPTGPNGIKRTLSWTARHTAQGKLAE